MTSERAHQVCVCGGAPGAPLSILALEPNLAKKSCSPERCYQFQLIWPLFGIFFQKSQKKISEYWKSIKIWPNMSEISKEQFRLAMGICTRRKSGICKGALEPTRTFYTLKFMILISLSKSVGSLKIHKGLIFDFKTS